MKMIFARTQNNVIGIENKLPWHVPEDMKVFREYTIGNTVIMGRNTFESFAYKSLAKRKNVVVSSTIDPKKYPDVEVHRTLVDAVASNPDAIIIGGAQLYQAALDNNLVTEVSESIIHGFVHPESGQSVTYFEHNFDDWDCVQSKSYLEFTHKIYRRK